MQDGLVTSERSVMPEYLALESYYKREMPVKDLSSKSYLRNLDTTQNLVYHIARRILLYRRRRHHAHDTKRDWSIGTETFYDELATVGDRRAVKRRIRNIIRQVLPHSPCGSDSMGFDYLEERHCRLLRTRQ